MSSDEAKGGETAPAADAGSGAGAGGGDDGAATAAPSEGDRKSVDAPLDRTTKSIVQRIPLLTVRAGPRDGEEWGKRLKEELQALIAYIKINKENDNDWFTIAPNKTGTRWTGKCWYYYKQLKYEFDLEFEMPVTYPENNPELCLPELEGKTAKMYRGGKICLSIHFMPLWSRNVPRFGIAHALALGMGPWLAAEIPHMVDHGLITHAN